ncbi:hypothetical protein B4902_16290 [Yersinia frederiksenii]|nr:hypothetical protein B4902_16290 [Yersinia frederiksenii]
MKKKKERKREREKERKREREKERIIQICRIIGTHSVIYRPFLKRSQHYTGIQTILALVLISSSG